MAFKEQPLKPVSEVGSKTTYTLKSENKEKLIGGKGDSRPDSDFDQEHLMNGIKVEMEHTNDPDVAKEIAKDHLTESPKYYKKLKVMEHKLEDTKKSLARANSLVKALKKGSLNQDDMDIKKNKAKLGSGARFKKLSHEIAEGGAKDPDAVAAAIGRKKYGKKKFAKLGAAGKKSLDANEEDKPEDIKKKFKSKAQQKYMYAAEERGDIPKKVVEEFSDKTSKKDYKKMPNRVKKAQDDLSPSLPEVVKALKAAAILGLTRRQRMDTAYRLGLAQGVHTHKTPFATEDLSNTPINIGISKEQTRPSYEPPVVPIRRIDNNPGYIAPKPCGDHEYKTSPTGPAETKPIKDR